MPKHPTIDVPNIGPMDHAWDLLGEWYVELDTPTARGLDEERSVRGTLFFPSWTEAELQLDTVDAALTGLPEVLAFERASRVHVTDAGGGALQWVLIAPAQALLAPVTLWPGSLHLFVQDADDDERPLFRLHAGRSREYYLQKYPLVPS